jgi:nucleoside-diphosphate-sugar epimerase
MMSDRILVTGGSGFVGSALIPALCASGREVLALARSATASATVRELGATPISGDIMDPDSLTDLPTDLDAVVHLAATPIMKMGIMPKVSPFDGVRASRVDGSRNLLGALAGSSRLRLFVAASAAAYPPGPERHSEDDALWAGNKYGALIVEWEVASRSGPFPTVLLRFPPMYGPSLTGGLGAVFLPALTKGKGPKVIGNPGDAGSYLHVDDAVSAILACLDGPPEPGVFNLADDAPVTPMGFAEAASEAFGAKSPSSLPAFMVKLVVGKDLLELFQTPPALDNSHAKDRLGWTPRYPDPAAGWRAIAEAVRD